MFLVPEFHCSSQAQEIEHSRLPVLRTIFGLNCWKKRDRRMNPWKFLLPCLIESVDCYFSVSSYCRHQSSQQIIEVL
ncbi:MAG: hypothetical protein EZS28_042337 [Streblomastix strix]|uniref:Uncharacterized protein n=1 Tax=Streblomastix strix TaxID=222440 RepID=A0A5J4TV27_9EUKA|nr:MAG: hypothetical protein EZS28_042337 [Streblomastix strix]